MARKKQDPEIRKSEFIEAATKLYMAKGEESTSVRDILKALGGESGLSPSVFYYYFKSKDELTEACGENYVEKYAEEMVAFLKDESLNYSQKMCKILQRIREALCACNSFNLNKEGINYFHDAMIDKFFKRFVPELSQLIGEGVKNGLLPITDLLEQVGPEMVARLICSGMPVIFYNSGIIKPQEFDKRENRKIIPAYVAQILGIPMSVIMPE